MLVATVRCLGLSTGLEDDPQAVLQTVRRYVHVFFGCKECGEHFEEMAKESIDSVKTPDQAILWLWKKHNLVNSRLAGEHKPLGGRACVGPEWAAGACLSATLRAGLPTHGAHGWAVCVDQFPSDLAGGWQATAIPSSCPGVPDALALQGSQLCGCGRALARGSPLGPRVSTTVRWKTWNTAHCQQGILVPLKPALRS